MIQAVRGLGLFKGVPVLMVFCRRQLSTLLQLPTRIPPGWSVELITNHEDSGVASMNKWMGIVCVAFAFTLVWQINAVTAQDRRSMFTAGRSDAGSDKPRRPLTKDEMVELRRKEALLDFDAETSLDHGETIHPELMETVKDNTIGVRYEEREAYLRVLRLAQEVPLRQQERFAAQIRSRREASASYSSRRPKDFPQFVDLFAHPDIYRGRPVTLHGVMRKLTKFEVGKNSLDLDQLYEGWVYPPDGQGNPAVVVFSSKDDRLPVSGDIQEEVRFTGYFFKMYGYDAQDTARKAPLIIAGEVEWVPHSYRPAYHDMNAGWYGVITLAFLIGCYLVWQVNRIEQPPRPLPQVELDFNHFPPREHPASNQFQPHSVTETEDS